MIINSIGTTRRVEVYDDKVRKICYENFKYANEQEYNNYKKYKNIEPKIVNNIISFENNIIEAEKCITIKEFLESLKKIPYVSFRVNQLKYSNEEFERLLKEQQIDIIKKVDSVYYVDSGILLYSQEFLDGKIIVQDGSSYLAAKNLDPKPLESVLDCCSAPGGKTAVLGELMENKGELLALDI